MANGTGGIIARNEEGEIVVVLFPFRSVNKGSALLFLPRFFVSLLRRRKRKGSLVARESLLWLLFPLGNRGGGARTPLLSVLLLLALSHYFLSFPGCSPLSNPPLAAFENSRGRRYGDFWYVEEEEKVKLENSKSEEKLFLSIPSQEKQKTKRNGKRGKEKGSTKAEQFYKANKKKKASLSFFLSSIKFSEKNFCSSFLLLLR